MSYDAPDPNGGPHTVPHATMILIDPGTGLPYSAFSGSSTTEATGLPFDLSACSHSYDYSDGLLITDTAINSAGAWVKTYTWTSGVLTAESKWVKQ